MVASTVPALKVIVPVLSLVGMMRGRPRITVPSSTSAVPPVRSTVAAAGPFVPYPPYRLARPVPALFRMVTVGLVRPLLNWIVPPVEFSTP